MGQVDVTFRANSKCVPFLSLFISPFSSYLLIFFLISLFLFHALFFLSPNSFLSLHFPYFILSLPYPFFLLFILSFTYPPFSLLSRQSFILSPFSSTVTNSLAYTQYSLLLFCLLLCINTAIIHSKT